ncbi:hypothetical protein NQ317_011322 [Molorchus minor]|uniref:Uncharacterized protein n=1 Tax=Molorchus minor TaxID=1323400 RepID=A0ABQ9JI99_9CUCU|nr:hypothetical protein NQ317_011322 [Molorchus minor]
MGRETPAADPPASPSRTSPPPAAQLPPAVLVVPDGQPRTTHKSPQSKGWRMTERKSAKRGGQAGTQLQPSRNTFAGYL